MRPKNRKQRKNANNEAENKEPTVTDDPVVKEPIHFNIFSCGNNRLNKLDATCERAFMTTPRDKYNTEFFRTITDCNDPNGAIFLQ